MPTNPTSITISDGVTVIPTAWAQGINDWVNGSYGVLGSTYTVGAFRAALSAAASGANTDITSLAGTATNDSAAAGKIGEIISSVVLQGAASAMTSGNSMNVTSLSLTAGDWDVHGNVLLNMAATTNITAFLASISLASVTINTDKNSTQRFSAFVPGANLGQSVPTIRVSIAAPTTVYLVATAAFTVSTIGAFGSIYARRAR